MKRAMWLRIGLAGFAIMLIAIRLWKFDVAPDSLDSTILLLFVTAVLVVVLPWDKLTSFRAAGVEVHLEQPHVQGALAAMRDAQLPELHALTKTLAEKIGEARGGRVLWIDDKPHNVVGERRFLRSLGIEIIPANPNTVQKRIEEDNDYDLIISDIQWRTEDGSPTYGGVELIKDLREKHPDPVISALPVLFYTGYKPEQVAEIVKQVGIERYLKVQISYSIESLVRDAIITIAESRANPIKVGKKQPT